MKVGIITFHRALNYGAVLQAYALQLFLKELNIESDIIDYRCPYIEEFYKPVKANPFRAPKMYIRELIYALPNISKRKKFEGFIAKNIKTSDAVCSREDLKALNSKYDYFIAGSDQVWNSKWSNFDKTFFLDFADPPKKYSYAASFGFDEVPKNEEATYEKLLADFQAISVRETTGVTIVDKLLHRKALVASDPSCLICKDEWKKIAATPKDSGYVLLYTLEKSDKLMSYA